MPFFAICCNGCGILYTLMQLTIQCPCTNIFKGEERANCSYQNMCNASIISIPYNAFFKTVK